MPAKQVAPKGAIWVVGLFLFLQTGRLYEATVIPCAGQIAYVLHSGKSSNLTRAWYIPSKTTIKVIVHAHQKEKVTIHAPA